MDAHRDKPGLNESGGGRDYLLRRPHEVLQWPESHAAEAARSDYHCLSAARHVHLTDVNLSHFGKRGS